MALCYLVQLFNQLESGTNLSMCLRALIKGQVGLVTGDRVFLLSGFSSPKQGGGAAVSPAVATAANPIEDCGELVIRL